MKTTDYARVFQPIPLRLNYWLISIIRYLQRLACLPVCLITVRTNTGHTPKLHSTSIPSIIDSCCFFLGRAPHRTSYCFLAIFVLSLTFFGSNQRQHYRHLTRLIFCRCNVSLLLLVLWLVLHTLLYFYRLMLFSKAIKLLELFKVNSLLIIYIASFT